MEVEGGLKTPVPCLSLAFIQPWFPFMERLYSKIQFLKLLSLFAGIFFLYSFYSTQVVTVITEDAEKHNPCTAQVKACSLFTRWWIPWVKPNVHGSLQWSQRHQSCYCSCSVIVTKGEEPRKSLWAAVCLILKKSSLPDVFKSGYSVQWPKRVPLSMLAAVTLEL